MNNVIKFRAYVGRLLLLVVLPFACSFIARGEGPHLIIGNTDQKLAVLQTRTGSYTNVTVTKKTHDSVFILHSTGACNIKVSDMSPEVRHELGYDAELEDHAAVKSASTNQIFAQLSQVKLSNVKELAKNWRQNGVAKITALTGSNPMLLYVGLGILAFVYIFVSTCFWLICRKTHIAPGPLVWVPVLQLIPLLRAANMSLMWFFAFFIPIVNIVAQIMWSVKIVQSRGKSPWVAFMMILPLINFFAFLYLAFSSSAPVVVKEAYHSMALETA